jgi:hypothetical protein
MIVVYTEKYREPINKNVELLINKVAGMYNYHSALKV